MANCIEQGFVKGTKEYDDCVKARREEKVSSIVDPLLVKEKDNDVEKINYEKDTLFKQGGKEVEAILGEYTSAIPNLTYEPDVKYVSRASVPGVKMKFTKDNGDIIESDFMRIGVEGQAEKNLGIFQDFINKNLSDEELTSITDSFLLKSKEQQKIDSNYLDDEVVNEVKLEKRDNNKSFYNEDDNGKLIPNLSLFDEVKTKTKEVYQMGVKIYGGKEIIVKPYSEDLQVNIDKLTAENLKNEKQTSTEDILEQAKLQTIIDLTSKSLNEKKKDIIRENNQDINVQAKQFVGTRLLQNKIGEEIKDKVIEQTTSGNSLKIYEQVLDTYKKITDGDATQEEINSLDENLNILNVNKINKDYFKSGMSYSDYVKQGGSENENLSELQEVTLTNGTIVDKNVLDNYKNLYLHAKSEHGVFKKRQIEIADLISNIEDNNIAFELASKNYSELDKYMANIGVGFSDIGFNLTYGTGKVLNFIGKVALNGRPAVYTGQSLKQMLGSNGIDKALDSLAVDYVEETNEIRNSFVKAPDFGADIFKDPVKFAKFMGNEFSTQVPIFATMMATGGYGALVIGSSTAGGKRATMAHEIATGQKQYSIPELILKPIGYGLAEGLIAHYTTVPIIKANKLRFTQLFKKSDVVENGTKEYFKQNAMSGFVYEPLLETGGESLTQGLQNLIDGRPFTENMGHAGFSGFSMSMIMSGSSFSYGAYMSRNSDFKTRSKLRDEQRKLDDLSLERESLNKKLNDGRYSDVNKKKFKEAINIIDGDIKNQTIAVENAMDKIESIIKNNYREGHANLIKGFLSSQTNLQNQAQDILSNDSFTDQQKSDKIKALSSKFHFIQDLMDNSLSENSMMKFRPEFDLLEAGVNEDGTQDLNAQQKFMDYMDESAASILAENGNDSVENIRRGAYDLYVRDVVKQSNVQAGKNKFAKLNFKQYETVDDAINAINNGDILKKADEETKKKAIEGLKGGADGFADKASGLSVVVVDNQVENQRKFTGVHEIGHQLFWNIFAENSSAFAPIARQLLKTTKSIDPKLYEKIIKQTEKDGDGNLKTQEVIMRFLEAAAGGEIKMIQKASGWKGLFGVMIQKEFVDNFDYNFDFKGETDIVNWVIGLANKLKDGSLDLDKLNSSPKGIGSTIAESLDVKGNVDAETDTISLSQGDLKNQFDSIVQNEDGTRKFESKEEFDNSIEKDNLQVLIETTNTLDASIRNLPGVTQAYLDLNPDFVEDVKRRISDKAMSEFNPGKNESFFGWMTGKNVSGKSIIELAAGDIQNRNKKEIDTSSIDASTRQVADQTTNTTTKSEVTPIIDVMKFAKKADPSLDVKAFEQDFNKGVEKLAKEKGIDITNPNLTSKQLQEITPYDVLAKAIGIPANKLSNPKDNLSKAESLKAQRLLLTAKPFIKNVVLGQANKQIQTVPSLKPGGKPVKVGGETLGLGRNILNKFFNPPKRVGNNYVRTPKEFNNKVYEASIGVKDGKVDPNYVPRAAESQIIKGLLKGVAEQMANKGARNLLETKEQTSEVVKSKANLERGKNELVFSEGININPTAYDKSQLQFFAQAEKTGKRGVAESKGYKSIKTKSEEYIGGIKPVEIDEEGTVSETESYGFVKKRGVYDLSTTEIKARNKWVQDLAKSGLFNEDFFWSGNFASNEKQLFRNTAELKAVLKGIKFDNNNKSRIKRFHYKNKSPKQIRDYMNSPEGKAAEAGKMDYLLEIMKAVQSDLKSNPENITWWQAIFDDSQDSQNHFIRSLAPINFFSTISDPKGMVEEHSLPAARVANYLLLAAFDQQIDSRFNFIKENYFQGQLRKTDDDKLKGPWFNYQSKMPKEFYTMDNMLTWIRYNNPDVAAVDGGIDFSTYEMIKEGNTAEEFLAQQAMDIVVAFVETDNVIKKGIEANENIEPLALSAAPETLNKQFNKIIEQTLGVDSKKVFSDIVAKRRGAKKGRFRPFVPPSMEDFQGLMYDLYTKGTLGEQQMAWVKKNLIDPYQKGVANIDVYRQTLKQDYKALLKKFPNVKKNLGKIVPGTDFTQDQAIRVSLWTKAGYEIPGISKRDAKKLNDFVDKNPELGLFGEGALLVSKQKNWAKPDPYWDVQSILSDLNNFTNNVGRQQYLEEFNANVDAIFSKENLNKLEASLGSNWRSAMEDSLYRMQTGTNRPSGADKLTNAFLNWTNNSIGAIMFFNRKSALLQTISSVNFLNWSDNNPVKAAMAFANFPQFIKDFAFLWNSPKLKQRRAGLRSDVNEAEIANAVRGATNKAQAMISYLLKIGFTPTQLADSFAIASGGATFYRNRLNTYKKDGLTEEEASKKAFEDFSETSEVSQQSADPMFISQQQAGILGRLILAFQNTPAQVTRLFKKASRDFINVRGDQKTNMSKMVYYGAVQGLIFAALQNAIFIGMDEDDEDEDVQRRKDLKQSRILNSMTDTLLRGSGVYGAIVATLKNTINTYYREKDKSAFGKENANVILEALNLSPPIGSKLRKISNALKTEDFQSDQIEKMGWDVTYKGRVVLSPKYNVIASTTEALTNIPLERAMNEFLALSEMMDQRNSTLQRIALALGYRAWDVGAKIEEFDEIEIEAKQDRATAAKERAKLKREEAARIKEAKKYEGKTPEQIVYIKRYEVVMKQKKDEQVKTLSDLGLTTKQIKALKYEKDRAKKILELQDKTK